MNIGEAARASGVSERMIRHYEKIGLVPPAARRSSGYRDYSADDVNRLRFVANARDLGFPIGEIATLLSLWSDRARASAEVKSLALARADALHRKAEALEAMRRSLLDLAERCHGDERPDCPILERLSAASDAAGGRSQPKRCVQLGAPWSLRPPSSAGGPCPASSAACRA